MSDDKRERTLKEILAWVAHANADQLVWLGENIGRLAPKPAPVVPSPEELVERWRNLAVSVELPRGETLCACAYELELSHVAHPRPVARKLTPAEALDVCARYGMGPSVLVEALPFIDQLRGLRP